MKCTKKDHTNFSVNNIKILRNGVCQMEVVKMNIKCNCLQYYRFAWYFARIKEKGIGASYIIYVVAGVGADNRPPSGNPYRVSYLIKNIRTDKFGIAISH